MFIVMGSYLNHEKFIIKKYIYCYKTYKLGIIQLNKTLAQLHKQTTGDASVTEKS